MRYNSNIKTYFKILILLIIVISINKNKTINATDANENWWDYQWSYRKKIIIDPFFVSGTHNDFPLLINIKDQDLSKNARDNGEDIIFTSLAGKKLKHEIETFNKTSGHLIAWVNLPTLYPYPETTIFLYYGNPNAQTIPDPHPWSSHHQLILHLNEKGNLTVIDSSRLNNNGFLIGGFIQGTPGMIGDGYDFFARISRYEYTGGYIEIDNNEHLNNLQNCTVSFWLKLEDFSRRQTIFNKYDTYQNQRGWFIGYNNHSSYGPCIELYISEDGTKFTNWYGQLKQNILSDEWNYYTISWDINDVPKFYLNGIKMITFGKQVVSGVNKNEVLLWIGDSVYANERELNGILDEIRIYNISKPSNWILTEYVSQHQNEHVFFTEKEERLISAPNIINPLPKDSEYNVSINLSEISFALKDYQGDRMNYTVDTSPNIGNGIGINVADGRYSISIDNLQYSQTYVWRVNVTDGLESTTQLFKFTPTRPGEDLTPPKADAGPDEILLEDEIHQFDGSNSTDNVGIANFTWKFYDSNIKVLEGIRPTYVFTHPGEYVLELIVTDTSGNQNSDTKLLNILDVTKPLAIIGEDKVAYVENNVMFDGSKSTDNVEIVYYKWNLDDGTVYFDPEITHTFFNVGEYNVTFTVKDEAGNEDTKSIMVTIQPKPGSSFFLTIIFTIFLFGLILIGQRIFVSSPRKKFRFVREND